MHISHSSGRCLFKQSDRSQWSSAIPCKKLMVGFREGLLPILAILSSLPQKERQSLVLPARCPTVMQLVSQRQGNRKRASCIKILPLHEMVRFKFPFLPYRALRGQIHCSYWVDWCFLTYLSIETENQLSIEAATSNSYAGPSYLHRWVGEPVTWPWSPPNRGGTTQH